MREEEASPMSRCVFDNSADQAQGRFFALESCYDPFSRRQVELTGIARGRRCLEAGGGGGSLGDWLGEQVGPDGEVTITDLDLRRAESRPRPSHVRLLRHDIVQDPLPADGYDLVHARLVLQHLPERLDVLARLAGALRPGGRLVLEEFDTQWMPVPAAPDEEAAALFERVHTALRIQLEKAGLAPAWGSRVPGAMLGAGLADVTATTYAESWAGGGTGIGLHRVNAQQMAGRLRAEGLTDAELDTFQALLADPAFVVNSLPVVSTRGRRP
ncbi:class I SAM-dependent methyltransferase [Streptomyces sp. ActVer]|uniref:class I SAM-dependent methyltransferase n=1 Tax=Streptomyces sp. ActVer TaxID=3014558 RepID=UPI0022B3BFBE|nr:class I SAM-dependent methyltransferase [Streptomyces sp. ActVer]MCZ4510799.1 class I SAM-dependent methyltransferase [Streptomyces sp. ActVer]